ncbi:MAG: hypothetical protein NDP13_02425 [Crenarchaeota archaeon]|nr:hypothetical protein [Thermoproteota archaeon]MCR8453827.1 hypothetical protein [Thermoproteota archaeon]MCR8455622.1 hypothetical protein [Thermoproteota archaeon]MCR8462624.1 hypothetical protein [Thermoproteota archaeon]MCR8470933.1 hypothetical protein [Thermoproteota archaeon]
MYKILGKFRRLAMLVLDNKGSQLVEEGLLIGLAMILFVIIVGFINGIVDWINSLSSVIL